MKYDMDEPTHVSGDVIVLLTATVAPNSPKLAGVLADVDDRQAQYRGAIREWARMADSCGFRLAIVETSGESRESLLRSVNGPRGHIQTVSFVPDEETVSRGKGAAELAAVQFALQSLTRCSDETDIYKVTGRLVLRNPQILMPIEPNGIRLRMTLSRSFADTRVIGASKRVWLDLLNDKRSDLNDASGVFLEHFVAAQVASASALKQITVYRFASSPDFIGVSGQDGTRYSNRRPLMVRRLITFVEAHLAALGLRKQV